MQMHRTKLGTLMPIKYYKSLVRPQALLSGRKLPDGQLQSTLYSVLDLW